MRLQRRPVLRQSVRTGRGAIARLAVAPARIMAGCTGGPEIWGRRGQGRISSVGADPPPPPQVSPDGKFYWDGQRWVPMQGRAQQLQPPTAVATQLPPGYEIKKQGHFWRNGLIGCAGIIALIIFIPWCAGLAGVSTSRSSSSGTGSPPAPQPTSSPTAKASQAPAALTVFYDRSGSGINKTPIFQTPNEWQIVWNFDCTNFGQSGNFQIFVYDGGGRLVDLAANALAMRGQDTSYEHNLSGPYYLQMNSECDWHVTVKG